MPHSYGYRARTRHLFKRKFREHGDFLWSIVSTFLFQVNFLTCIDEISGVINSQTYLTTFKVGELVDVHGNGAVQKGMPHKYYVSTHGLL